MECFILMYSQSLIIILCHLYKEIGNDSYRLQIYNVLIGGSLTFRLTMHIAIRWIIYEWNLTNIFTVTIHSLIPVIYRHTLGFIQYWSLTHTLTVASLEKLKSHEMVYIGVKPYSYIEYQIIFFYITNLQTHEMIHTGFKIISCTD